MTEKPTTCTVQFATGLCGKPAVHVFWSDFAECYFAECERHYEPEVEPIRTGTQPGDVVDVHRYGKTYRGVVVHVTRNGRVKAEFTYGNGVTRQVWL